MEHVRPPEAPCATGIVPRVAALHVPRVALVMLTRLAAASPVVFTSPLK